MVKESILRLGNKFMSVQKTEYRHSSVFECLQPKEMAAARVAGMISAALAFAAILFGLHLLMSSLRALRNEEALNVQFILALTESVWIHALICVAVMIDLGFLFSRTVWGLIVSAVMVLFIALFVFRWTTQIESLNLAWPRIGGPNLVTLPLFISLALRAVGELTLSLLLVRGAWKRKVSSRKA